MPGVIILDCVNAFIKQHFSGSTINRISQAKFHQPLRPAEIFVIHLEQISPDGFKFECLKSAEKIASGKLSIHQLHD